MAWFTPSGQPVDNPNSTASNPPNVDITTEVGGTPMFKEDYDPNNDQQVTEAERVQGREAYELFDGLRILGKDIQSGGLSNNKFLKFDSASDSWVLSSATGDSNLADLNDVQDGTPSNLDMLGFQNNQWEYLSGVTSNFLASPVGNNVTFGITDGAGELRIQGGTTADDKRLSFGYNNSGSYAEQWTFGVDSTTDFNLEKADGTVVLSANTAQETVRIKKLLVSAETSAPTALEGGIYYLSLIHI